MQHCTLQIAYTVCIVESTKEQAHAFLYISIGITLPSSHDMQHNHMIVTWQGTQLVSDPDPQKAGSGKQGGVEVYTAEFY